MIDNDDDFRYFLHMLLECAYDGLDHQADDLDDMEVVNGVYHMSHDNEASHIHCESDMNDIDDDRNDIAESDMMLDNDEHFLDFIHMLLGCELSVLDNNIMNQNAGGSNIVENDENYVRFLHTLLECEFNVLDNNIINGNAGALNNDVMNGNVGGSNIVESDKDYLCFLHTLLECEFNVLDNHIINENAGASTVVEMDIVETINDDEDVNKEDEDGSNGDQVGYVSMESDCELSVLDNNIMNQNAGGSNIVENDENYVRFLHTLLECEFNVLDNNIINGNAGALNNDVMNGNVGGSNIVESDKDYLCFLHTLLECEFNVLDNHIINENAGASTVVEMDIVETINDDEDVNKEDEDGSNGDQVGYVSMESDDNDMDDNDSKDCMEYNVYDDCVEEYDDYGDIEYFTTKKSTNKVSALRGGNVRYSSDEEEDTVASGEYEHDEAALLDIDDMDDEEDIEVMVGEEIILNEGSGINGINRNALAEQLAQTNPIGARYNMDATLPQPAVTRHSLGEMNVTCSFCNALGFRCENKGTLSSPHFGRLCCNQGKSKFENYPYLPDELMQLYEGNTAKAKYFRKHIRYFNSGMAMASLTAGQDATVRGKGPPGAYRINGIMYRRIGAITSYEGCTNPKFVQTYFYSSEEQSAHRSTRSSRQQGSNENGPVAGQSRQHNSNSESTMEVDIFELLRKILVEDCRNTYLTSFYTVNEFIQNHGLNPEEIEIELLEPTDLPYSGYHDGRLHLPAAPEVAILIDPDFHQASVRPFLCTMRNQHGDSENHTKIFPVHHRSYIPLAYPLLFPYGTHGWGRYTKNINNKKAKHLEFLRYHLMMRCDHQNYIFLAEDLLQQLYVDEYERQEFARLRWHRLNQRKIKAEKYGRLFRLRALGVGSGNMGQNIILPATSTGSDRWYLKQYRNAMSLVRVLGKPTLFLTCTLDTGCTEVKSYLRDGQQCYDRPDLLNRVFNAKYTDIIHDITKGNIFGKCNGYVSSVEFQKRGAPHVHIIIWLDNFQMTPYNIDNIVSAEIPVMGDIGSEERVLYDLVMSKMVHGPCGCGFNNNLACRKKDISECSKKFPREFNPSTVVMDDNYPLYRRRAPDDPSGGGNVGYKFVRGEKVRIDNRWVVPYSPYLLLKYGCHCNLEFCNSIRSVKYLFKYQMKGCDMITVRLPNGTEIRDEVKEYTHKRYISATFAHWRIGEYDMVRMLPGVVRLGVHDLGEHEVYFEPNMNAIQHELNNSSATMLTDFFVANACPTRGPIARTLLYEDFPTKFAWKNDLKAWKLREKNIRLYGRMDNVHPSNVEVFHLRLLLKHRRGMISFQDIRTVDGIDMGSYQAAAIALNLCQNDQNYIDCLEDAVIFEMPFSLRQLYSTILIHCIPADPRSLLVRFKTELMEDFTLKRRQILTVIDEDTINILSYNDLLCDIRSRIADAGFTLLDFGLDEPDEALLQSYSTTDEDDHAYLQTYYETNRSKLTNDQEEIFNIIARHIDESSGGLYTIDAPGGCGKTFLCNIVLAYTRMQNKIAFATALSGIAATLMRKGTTFHRRFGAPCNCTMESMSSIKLGSKEAEHIRKASIIFIDEVSMMNRELLDFLDRFLRSVTNTDMPMGDKLVVLMHDFRQLLPVVQRGSRGDIVHSCVTFSDVWKHFTTLQLTKNMRVELLRVSEDSIQSQLLDMHSKWLLSIGEGTLDYAIPGTTIFEIPHQMSCDSLEELENKVFGDLHLHYLNSEYLRDRAIMSCTNDVIQMCNQQIVSRLPGEHVICESTYRFVNDDDNLRHDTGSLACINPSGLPPHVLHLKVGTCIILIRNLNIKEGHCNGTRYIILDLTTRCIRAKKLNATGDGSDEIFIPRIPLRSNESDYPVPFIRMQFPVLLAYYLTISRAQGQTFKKAGMYLPKNVFSHGHMYVGLSRCGDPNGLYIYADQGEFKHVRHMLEDTKVYSKNVVYTEMLK